MEEKGYGELASPEREEEEDVCGIDNLELSCQLWTTSNVAETVAPFQFSPVVAVQDCCSFFQSRCLLRGTLLLFAL